VPSDLLPFAESLNQIKVAKDITLQPDGNPQRFQEFTDALMEIIAEPTRALTEQQIEDIKQQREGKEYGLASTPWLYLALLGLGAAGFIAFKNKDWILKLFK
jgi:hypothetical protein